MSDFYFHEHNVDPNKRPTATWNTGTNMHDVISGFFSPGSPGIAAVPSDPVDGLFSNIPDDFIDQLREAAARYGEDGVKSGVDQKFLDALDRIPNKSLKKSDECAICATPFLDQDHPLVVRLPCNSKHQFDLECIGPWLKENSTCPMCRRDFKKKKEPPAPVDSEDEDDIDAMYG